MRWRLLSLTAAAVLTGALTFPRDGRHIPQTRAESPARKLEVARLRAHFDSVDAELRQVDAGPLTPAQRTGRAMLIAWLREYRDAGSFPRNDRFAEPMPFFRDSRGALCAMAYLIDRSGRGDLVDRVASTRNNAFIAQLADDPALVSWLDSTGLSVAEAARIQPQYGSDVVEGDDPSTGYTAASIVLGGASLTSLVLNVSHPSRTSAWVGVIAGGVGVLAGGANLDREGDTEKLAAANLAVGGVAMLAGLYTLFNRPSDQLALGPTVIPTSDGPRLGLAMHRSF